MSLTVGSLLAHEKCWYNQQYTQQLLGLTLSDGRKITDVDYYHFYRRVRGRHSSIKVVLDALTNSVYTVETESSIKYVSIDATVVVTSDGMLKTFWYNNRHYRWAIHHGYHGECDIMTFCRRYNKQAATAHR